MSAAVRPRQPAPNRGGAMMAVTALGMATSLAPDATTSCAAARAGLTRPTELELEVEDDDGQRAPIMGHCLRTVTEGFVGIARLLRLTSPALDDLLRSTGDLDGATTALFVHVRDRYYDAASAASDRAADFPRMLAGQPPDVLQEWSDIEARTQSDLLESLGGRLKVPAHLRTLSRGGAAALVTTLVEAGALLARGTVKRCIVGAIDSLVEPRMVLTLADLDLLKTPDNPVGFAPGEGAGFVVLEPGGAPGALATLSGLSFAQAAEHRFSARRPTGIELRDAAIAAVGAVGRDLDVGAAITNLSGDEYRAHDLANAIVALSANGVSLTNADLWYPAISFGETGAAAAMLSLGVALRAFARGYARGRDVLLLTVSEDGGRGAVVVSQA
jgi:hypothetical protein